MKTKWIKLLRTDILLVIFWGIICSSCSELDWREFAAAPPQESEEETGPADLATLGSIIVHSPASTKKYVGSPSIAILSDGTYIASHDREGGTTIYRSSDRGENWQKISDVSNMFWANLFVHKGALYLFGVNTPFKDIHIRRSENGGVTWSNPVDNQSGVLFQGDRYHTAPVSMVIHEGRIWRSFENNLSVAGRDFQTLVISADIDADLLKASSWTATNRIRYDENWGGKEWIEGSLVVTPDNKLVNMLRTEYPPQGERAAIVHVDNENTISFNPASDFIDFPGGNVKFTVRYDEVSGKYWSLTNYIAEEYRVFKPDGPAGIRNTLALISSTNLIDWNVNHIVLQHHDVYNVGFQYADWLFDGDDIVSVIRTAYPESDGTNANNFHDSNYILFKRVKGFRQFTSDIRDVELLEEEIPASTIGSIGSVSFRYRGGNVTYESVRASDGKIWLQRNLGAKQVATSVSDKEAYGDLFQWGRWDDGHQVVVRSLANPDNGSPVPLGSSLGSSTMPSPNNPTGLGKGKSSFFHHSEGWWRQGTLVSTWSASTVDDISEDEGCDPCKALGNEWRQPNIDDWNGVINAENITNVTSAFSSNLKLAAAGHRNGVSNMLWRVGTRGFYWSGTSAPSEGNALSVQFLEDTVYKSSAATRGTGYSIRCVRND